MKRLFSFVASFGLLFVAYSCGSSDGGGAPADSGASSAPTFTNVWRNVILKESCQSAQCHGAGAGQLYFTNKLLAYDNLVGVGAQGLCTDAGIQAGIACGCDASGKIRVVPFHPEESLLVEKLAGTPSCGDRMPPTGGLAPKDQRDLVTAWITAGAKND
jgi:hypothetical protein